MWDVPRGQTDSTTGANPVMNARSMPGPLAMFPVTSSATKTSMIMASGEAFRSMAPFGFRHESPQVGLPTASDIGSGSNRGDGHGLRMDRAASHPSTIAAGPLPTEN